MKLPRASTLARWWSANRKKYSIVSCGSCVECLQSKSALYTSKLLAESLSHRDTNGYFVTLTYDEFHLPPFGTLETDVISRFNDFFRNNVCKVHRINGKVKRDKIDDYLRYFAIGEYGTKHDRPHYHIVMWSELLSQNDIIQLLYSFWKDDKGLIGKIDVQPFMSTGAVGYVAKYHSKRLANILKGDLNDVTSLSFKLKNGVIEQPFIRCSKSLGLSFFRKPEIKRLYECNKQYVYNGFRLLLPPAYRIKVLGEKLAKKLAREYEFKQEEISLSHITSTIENDECYVEYLNRLRNSEKLKLKSFLEKQTSKF